MNWHRRLKFLHFLEVAFDLVWRCFLRNAPFRDNLEAIVIAWKLTHPNKEVNQ